MTNKIQHPFIAEITKKLLLEERFFNLIKCNVCICINIFQRLS